MSRKLKRFICICGVMILIGIVAAVAGVASGGIGNLKKVDEKYPSISFGYENLKHETYNFENVSAVNVNYSYGKIRFVEGDSFRVDITYAEDMAVPKVSESNGTINIGQTGSVKRILSLDLFGGRTESPEVLITCPKDVLLDSINIDADTSVQIIGVDTAMTNIDTGYGDLSVNGANLGNTKIDIGGDADLVNVTTSSLDVKSDGGDIVLNGNLMGKNIIDNSYGDVEFVSNIARENYDILVNSDYGDIDVGGIYSDNDDEFNGQYRYTGSNPVNTLSIDADGSDVELRFAM